MYACKKITYERCKYCGPCLSWVDYGNDIIAQHVSETYVTLSHETLVILFTVSKLLLTFSDAIKLLCARIVLDLPSQ